MTNYLRLSVLLALRLLAVEAFSNTPFLLRSQKPVRLSTARSHILHSTTSNKESSSTAAYKPVFDFSVADADAVSKFERIDDAIMGGISLSALKQLPEENFARWSGICRVDGGGFCGARTLPFEEPLNVGEADGLYLMCRLTSDEEPERRVWKVTTRSEQSRGEQLYQAMFEMPKNSDDDWNRVTIPFSSFMQVRGPRLVEGGAPLNTTGGLFQIGISLSKFQIGKTATEIENFRPGYFELQLKEIGVYKSGNLNLAIDSPNTLPKDEAEKRRPLVLKIILPVANLFFSEKRRRRNSAMRILRKRGLSRFQAVQFGVMSRARRNGMIVALIQSLGIFVQDLCRTIIVWGLRLSLFYPVVFFRRVIKFATKPFTTKKMASKDA